MLHCRCLLAFMLSTSCRCPPPVLVILAIDLFVARQWGRRGAASLLVCSRAVRAAAIGVASVLDSTSRREPAAVVALIVVGRLIGSCCRRGRGRSGAPRAAGPVAARLLRAPALGRRLHRGTGVDASNKCLQRVHHVVDIGRDRSRLDRVSIYVGGYPAQADSDNMRGLVPATTNQERVPLPKRCLRNSCGWRSRFGRSGCDASTAGDVFAGSA